MAVIWGYILKRSCLLFFFTITIIECMEAEDAHIFDLPASYNQTLDLAGAVCTELFEDPRNMSMVRICERNFLGYRPNWTAASVDMQIKCRLKGYMAFMVRPSEQYQLVALINARRREDEIINYIIVDPHKNHSGMFIPEGQYTVWTTLLNNYGSPSLWTRGPQILPWKEIQRSLRPRQYDIRLQYLPQSFEKNTHTIDAIISWDADDAEDACFDVLNYCNKKTQGDIFQKKVQPYQERSVSVRGLPLDDTCTFQVNGRYGSTNVTYHTLSCYNIADCPPLPEVVRHIDTDAVQEVNDTWSVRVKWTPPAHPPDFYNITLTANLNTATYTYNNAVSGNATEITFRLVHGVGIYIVVVESVAGGKFVQTSRKDLFPHPIFYISAYDRCGPSSPYFALLNWILTSSLHKAAGSNESCNPREVASADVSLLVEAVLLLGFLTTCALTFGAVCWRRRLTTKRRNIYFANVLEKMSGETNMNNENPETCSEDKWEVRPERLVLHEVIGEGAFGVVRRGTFAPTNKDVAVKMLKDFPSMEEIRSFRSEMELMKSVGAHPHVVSLVGCCSGRRPLILAEYCSRGDLLTFLRCSLDVMTSRRNAKYYNNNQKLDYGPEVMRCRDSKLVVNRLYDLQGVCDAELTILDLLSFCRQIAMGMEFLESNRVLHRDLAARNILVTADRTLKIADFGLSRDIYQENHYKQKGNGKMPVKWMALESLTQRIYTTQSDVWSFGIVMWEVVTLGGVPYSGVSAARLPRLLAAGYRMPRPHNCSPVLYDLMVSCWHSRPRARPTFSELHAALDALLYARADHYLPLDVENPPPIYSPPTPRRSYVMKFARSVADRNSLFWGHTKGYERPQTNSNHYTAQPALTTTRDISIYTAGIGVAPIAIASVRDAYPTVPAEDVQPT